MKSTLFISLALAAALLSACGEQKPIRESNKPVSDKTQAIIDSARQREVQRAKAAKEGAVYACPMGCEGSRSDKPGKCPTCGMTLEKKA
jgi:rubrerythrin